MTTWIICLLLNIISGNLFALSNTPWSSHFGKTLVNWHIFYTGGKAYGSLDIKSSVITPYKGRFESDIAVSIKLKPQVLAGGAYYRFRLTATNNENTAASAMVEFKTNSKPTTGRHIKFHCFVYLENHQKK